MVKYRSYDHVERFGSDDVNGIEIGKIYIFPKLDGTNAVIWCDEGQVCAGSRNRQITVESDNHGFAAKVKTWENSLLEIFKLYPSFILYGEFLKSHTIKTYRDDAWNKFYLFDVYDTIKHQYISYDRYKELFDLWIKPDGFEILQPLCIINNPSIDQLNSQVQTNTYLIKDGAGIGEGIVLKNYLWFNKYGRQPWAKIVTNDFKEKNSREFGVTVKEGPKTLEPLIVNEFCTAELVGKTKAKIIAGIANENNLEINDPNAQQEILTKFRAKIIPQLLGRVFHDLVTEEIWAILRKYGNPVLNFGLLNKLTILRVKEVCKDLF